MKRDNVKAGEYPSAKEQRGDEIKIEWGETKQRKKEGHPKRSHRNEPGLDVFPRDETCTDAPDPDGDSQDAEQNAGLGRANVEQFAIVGENENRQHADHVEEGPSKGDE